MFAFFRRIAARLRNKPGPLSGPPQDPYAPPRDYLTLRKKVFGIEQLQLPRSLALVNPSDQYLHPAAAAT